MDSDSVQTSAATVVQVPVGPAALDALGLKAEVLQVFIEDDLL